MTANRPLTVREVAAPIDFSGQLRGPLARKVAQEAERRNREPADLVADLLEKVIEDDLFAAILDD